jgi:hypothetical protein
MLQKFNKNTSTIWTLQSHTKSAYFALHSGPKHMYSHHQCCNIKELSYAHVTNKHSLLQWFHKRLQKVVPLFLESHLSHVDVTCWHCFISPLDTVILAGKPHKLVLNLKKPMETSVLYPYYNQSAPVQVLFSSKLSQLSLDKWQLRSEDGKWHISPTGWRLEGEIWKLQMLGTQNQNMHIFHLIFANLNPLIVLPIYYG